MAANTHSSEHLKMAAPTHPSAHIITGLESIQPILLTEEIAGIKHHWAQDINGNVDRKAIPTILVTPYAATIGALQNRIAEFIKVLRKNLFDDFYDALPKIPIRIVFQATNTGAYIISEPLILDSGITLEFEPGATIVFRDNGGIEFNGCSLIAGRQPIFLSSRVHQGDVINYWEMYTQGRFYHQKSRISETFEYFPLYGKVNCGDVYPEWFGAIGVYSNFDEFYAMKYALAFAANHAESKTLSLAGKTYHVCGTINSYEPDTNTMPLPIPLSVDISNHLQSFENPSIKLASPINCRYRLGLDDDFKQTKHLTGLRIIGEPGATIKSTSFTYSYEPDTESHLRRDDFGKHLYFELTNVALVQGIRFIDVGLVLRNQDTDADNNPLQAPPCQISDCEFVVTQDWGIDSDYKNKQYFNNLLEEYRQNNPPNEPVPQYLLDHIANTKSITNNWPTRCLDISGNIKTYDAYFSGLVSEYMRPVQQPRIERCRFINTNPLGFDELRYADYTTPVRKGIGITCGVFEDAIVAENHFEGLEIAMFISGAVRSRFERNRLKNLLSGIIFLMNKAYARTSVLYNTISHNYIEDVFSESISFDSGHGTSSLVSFIANEPLLINPPDNIPRGFLVLNGTNIMKGKIVRIAPIQTVLNGEPETTINNPLRVYFQLHDGNQLLSKGINYGDTKVNFNPNDPDREIKKEALLRANRNSMLSYFNFMFQKYLASGSAFCTITSGGSFLWSHQSSPEGHSFRILNAGRTESTNSFPKSDDLEINYAHGWLDLEYFPERFESNAVPQHPGHIPEAYFFPNSSQTAVKQASYLRHNSDQLVGAEISMQFIFGFNQITHNQIYFNEYRTLNFNENNSGRNNVTKPNNNSNDPNPTPTNQTLYLNHRRWRFFHDFGADANGILLYGSSHYNIISNNQLQGARIGMHGIGGDALGFGTYPGWDQNQYQFPTNIHYSPNNFNLISGNQIVRANIYAINEMGTGFYPFPATYFNGDPASLPNLRSFPNYNNGYNAAPNSGYRQPNELSDRYFFNIGNQFQFNLLAQGEYRLSWQKQFKLNDDEWFTWQKAQLHKIRETHLLLWPDYYNPGYFSQGTRFTFYLWVDNLQSLVSSAPVNDPLYMKSTVNP